MRKMHLLLALLMLAVPLAVNAPAVSANDSAGTDTIKVTDMKGRTDRFPVHICLLVVEDRLHSLGEKELRRADPAFASAVNQYLLCVSVHEFKCYPSLGAEPLVFTVPEIR